MIKLSTDTLEILKNFASINPNLLVKAGEKLSTISEAKNIMASSEITEEFESTFGIYDLNEFIRTYYLVSNTNEAANAVNKTELHFSEDAVTFKNGKARASYRFADQSILTTPKSNINMPSTDLTIKITANILSQIRKAENVLGHSIVSLNGRDGIVNLEVMDPKNTSANSFEINIDNDNVQTKPFNLQFLIPNLKVIPGDYDVSISSKLISHWRHVPLPIVAPAVTADPVIPVQYYIALEKTSTFN